MGNLDARVYRVAAGYLIVVVAIVLLSRLGAFPGTGERFPGDPPMGHPYRVSMVAVVAALAIGLGAISAWVGSVSHNWTLGLASLVVGGVATGTLLGLAPWILYPSDQYPVAFMWLMAGAPLGLLSWLGAAAAMRFSSS